MKRFVEIVVLAVLIVPVGCTTIPVTNKYDAVTQYSSSMSGGDLTDLAEPSTPAGPVVSG